MIELRYVIRDGEKVLQWRNMKWGEMKLDSGEWIEQPSYDWGEWQDVPTAWEGV